MAIITDMRRIRKTALAFVAVASIAGALASCGRTPTVSGVLRVGNDAGFGGAETMDPYDGNRTWPTINMVFYR